MLLFYMCMHERHQKIHIAFFVVQIICEILVSFVGIKGHYRYLYAMMKLIFILAYKCQALSERTQWKKNEINIEKWAQNSWNEKSNEKIKNYT